MFESSLMGALIDEWSWDHAQMIAQTLPSTNRALYIICLQNFKTPPVASSQSHPGYADSHGQQRFIKFWGRTNID